MSDWFFDDGSAQTLLDQNYGLDHGTTSWAEPQTVSAPSEDPLFGDDPTTDQHAVFPIGDVAPGGVIVGTFHTHPERSGTQEPAQDVFGRDDRDIADDLRDSEYARDNDISVDENAMTYVNDNETGDLKEFDSDDGVNDLGITVGPCGSGG